MEVLGLWNLRIERKFRLRTGWSDENYWIARFAAEYIIHCILGKERDAFSTKPL
jgi:hypothetical protein